VDPLTGQTKRSQIMKYCVDEFTDGRLPLTKGRVVKAERHALAFAGDRVLKPPNSGRKLE